MNALYKQERQFGLLFSSVIAAVCAYAYYRGSNNISAWLIVSLTIAAVSLIVPKLLIYPLRIWLKIGHVLSWINTRILLGLVFFIILLPIGLIMRLFGHDPLRLKSKKGVKTYWLERQEGWTLKNFRRQF